MTELRYRARRHGISFNQYLFNENKKSQPSRILHSEAALTDMNSSAQKA